VSQTTPEAELFRQQQEHEYSTYVATGPIDFGNARAYNAGDPVPASNVERYGYVEQGLVARASEWAGS
jgi:hypothetical protein